MKSHVGQTPWRSRPYSADVVDDGDETPVEILPVLYRCPAGHERTVPFASTAQEIPHEWACNRCKLTATVVDTQGRDTIAPEPAGRDYHFRGHYEEVQARRTPEQLQALLEERLKVYRQHRVGFVGIHMREGEQAITRSNNVTTPFPKVDVSTPRRAAATIKRAEAWMLSNAIQEARERGDRRGLMLLNVIDLKNLSQSDKDYAESYLFGE